MKRNSFPFQGLPDPSGRQEDEDEARTGGTGGFEICWTGWRGVKGADILIVAKSCKQPETNHEKQIKTAFRLQLHIVWPCKQWPWVPEMSFDAMGGVGVVAAMLPIMSHDVPQKSWWFK